VSEPEQPRRIETLLYDAQGNLTTDESVAVSGEVVEFDSEGRVIARHAHDALGWRVDPKSLEGDAGEAATRPGHGSS
jgi:YD repeat-containing protein